MRSDEARLLRWSQVDSHAGHVVVGKSKTDAGAGRVIPMSGILEEALKQHFDLYASQLGPIDPNWFVFPASNRIRPTDPRSPVTSLKRDWEGVRAKAGVHCRLHDLRH
jgi:integrase